MCPPCGSDEACCEGRCTDLSSDPRACGKCDIGCSGTTCSDKICTNTCVQGFIDCNHNVVDGCEVNAAIDAENCGNCDIECGFDQPCVGGVCECRAGSADCDGVKGNGCETPISSDVVNCGACGKTCGANQVCTDGACVCAIGRADCNDQPADGCEADLTAAVTCGSCTLDCGPNTTCVGAGACGCEAGYLDCDTPAPGCETLKTDPTHCGSCTVSCAPPLPACNGTECISGCGALTACGASCINTQTDPANCGGCGNAVGANQVCVNGVPTCDPGFANCDGNAGDCETDTRSDPLRCGSCAGACKPGAVCSDSVCVCAPGTPNDCGAACQECCSDGQCSDGDSCTADSCNGGKCTSGAACAAGGKCCAGAGCFACCGDQDCDTGQVCSGNQCVTQTCTAPQVLCNGRCVTLTSDAGNCGACGNDCGRGRTCVASACTPRWAAAAAPPTSFAARERASAAAMGSKVFIWGGNNAANQLLGDGAVYDTASDTWTPIATDAQTPAPRLLAAAVWTGSVVVVWGGGNAGAGDFATGGRYDPATDSWQPMSSAGAPSARRAPYAFWTGSRVLFYGGITGANAPAGGVYLYDPVNDTWTRGDTADEPDATYHVTIGLSATQLLHFGGVKADSSINDKFHGYILSTDRWREMKRGPSARYGAFGGWDGAAFVVWSGTTNNIRADGKIYDPALDTWKTMQIAGAPSSRWAGHRYTGWSARLRPGVTLMIGGLSGAATAFLTDGAIYNSTTNLWSPVSSWPSGASHLFGVGVWTGAEFLVWGGRTGTAAATLTTAGERYLP